MADVRAAKNDLNWHAILGKSAVVLFSSFSAFILHPSAFILVFLVRPDADGISQPGEAS